MDEGYIKINRKILEWEWYTDINTKVLFLHFLLKANWKDGKFKGVDVPRGSLVTTYRNLASETGLSLRNVRTSLERLIATREVTLTTYPRFSIISINSYNLYQSDVSQVTRKRHASDTQVTLIEERKKRKNERIKEVYPDGYTQKVAEPDTPDSEQAKLAFVCSTIRNLYNSVCGSYPRLEKMTEKRRKAIKARLDAGYTLYDFQKIFDKAEASKFLKGENGRNWCANFDWLIAEDHMANILEGKYDDRVKGSCGSGNVSRKKGNAFNNFNQRDYDFDELEKGLLNV